MENGKDRLSWMSREAPSSSEDGEPEPAWMEELRKKGAALGPLAHLFPFAQLASVARRNERERRRVRQINSAFASLRSHVQHRSLKRKLSKVDTLKCAIEYIHYLQGVLGIKRTHKRKEQDATEAASPAPSWSSSDLDLGWCDDVETQWSQSPPR